MPKKKRMWVHPCVNARLLKGAFVTSFMELREDENKFFNYFRLSVKSFYELVVKFEDRIKLEDTKLRVAITPAEMLVRRAHNSIRIRRKFCLLVWYGNRLEILVEGWLGYAMDLELTSPESCQRGPRS
ncbi:hypothetical protein PR048_001375 [Dryococelus australis]|uniref:Uncharacterized protein n=1 Tax=Dryococelus australis TaxID=614101 RepID=A0ABQ9IIJ7_9NEOP|nr:hypothetical protein PR048_001375 [Dryococelus australis]